MNKQKIQDRLNAESATGTKQYGTLEFFQQEDPETALDGAEAAAVLRGNGDVESPNAGAGSYHVVIALLGQELLEVIEQSSSAGDWVFRLDDHVILTQTNRHPWVGFRYTLRHEY